MEWKRSRHNMTVRRVHCRFRAIKKAVAHEQRLRNRYPPLETVTPQVRNMIGAHSVF